MITRKISSLLVCSWVSVLPVCTLADTAAATANGAIDANRAERIKALETRINQLEGQIEKNKQENESDLKQYSDAFKLNGFISAVAAKTDGGRTEIAGIGDTLNTNADSVMGLQLAIRASENLSFTTQFVSRGVELHDTKTEWAFLTYKIAPDDAVQAGRLRIPHYLFSESLEVGFSYPWVRPPVEVYAVPISSLEGFQWTHQFAASGWQTDLSAYFGRGLAHDDVNKDDFILNRAWGSVLSSTKNDWQLRLSYSVGKIDVENIETGSSLGNLTEAFIQIGEAAQAFNAAHGLDLRTEYSLPMNNLLGEYTNAAVSYDNSDWLFTAELAHLTVSKAVVPAGNSGYVLFGKHIGKWLTHITFAKFYTDYKNDKSRAAFTDELSTFNGYLIGAGEVEQAGYVQQVIKSIKLEEQTQESVTLGLNYDVSNNLKLKWEATQFQGFHDGTGRFNALPGKRVALYSFSMDAIF